MKLSIVTINFNNINGLHVTIESVLSQTFTDFEWILIDGGSTDGSKELIEQLSQNSDAHVSCWRSEKDGGVYNAMNKAIPYAHGDYIYFLNSGDTLFNKKVLSKVFDKERTADVIYGDWLVKYKDHDLLRQFPQPFHLYHIYSRNICHQALFVRTDVMKQEGYDETYKMAADWCRWSKLAVNGGTFEYVGIIICNYDAYGLSSHYPNGLEELERLRRENFPKSELLLFERFRSLEYNHWVLKVKNIYDRGGFRFWMLRIVLKILG